MAKKPKGKKSKSAGKKKKPPKSRDYFKGAKSNTDNIEWSESGSNWGRDVKVEFI